MFEGYTPFPRYADHPNAYWTGYFTSRPAFKGYVRAMSSYYLVKFLSLFGHIVIVNLSEAGIWTVNSLIPNRLQGNWNSSKEGEVWGQTQMY